MSFKGLMIAIVTIMCYTEDITADCSKGRLLCFDSAPKLLGMIYVDRCWRWDLFKCSPCSANEEVEFPSIRNKLSNYKAFEKYLHHCRYYYPNTQLVYDWSIFY